MSRSSRRLFTLLGASLLALSQLGAATAVLATHDQPSSRSDHAIFFAADGVRQDAVRQLRGRGRDAHDALVPAQRHLRFGQRPADPGAPEHRRRWYTLATGAWPGIHGSTNNTFHKSGQPFANRTPRSTRARSRSRRSPSRPSARASRSRRSSGPAARTPPSTARRSTSSRSSRAAASRPTSSAPARTRCSTTPGSSPVSACSSTIRPATPGRRPSRVPPRPTRPAGTASRSRTARPRRCAFASSTAASTSTA